MYLPSCHQRRSGQDGQSDLARNGKLGSSARGSGRRRRESCLWDSRSRKACPQGCPYTPAGQGTKLAQTPKAFGGSSRTLRSQAQETEVWALPCGSQPFLPADSQPGPQPLPASHLPGLIIFPGSCVIPVLWGWRAKRSGSFFFFGSSCCS